MKVLFVVGFILFFACLVPSIKAQNAALQHGYYITQQGDTIRGYIRFSFSDKYNEVPEFKLSPQVTTPLPLQPDQVKLIAFENGKRLVSANILYEGASKPFFLQSLVQGNVTLYLLMHKRFVAEEYYVEQNEQFTRVNKIALKDFVEVYFKDCPLVKENAGKYRANESSLSRLITDYNRCIADPENFTPQSLSRELQYYIGGKVFYNNGQFRFYEKYFYDINENRHYPYNSLGIGVTGEIRKKQIGIRLDLAYVNHKSFADSVNVGLNYTTLDFDFGYLELPFAVNYNIKFNGFDLTPEAGFYTIFLLKADLIDRIAGSDTGFYKNSFADTRFAFGLMGGVGVSKKIAKRGNAFLRIRHIWIESEFRPQPIFSNFQIDLYNNKFEFAIGYILNLSKP